MKKFQNENKKVLKTLIKIKKMEQKTKQGKKQNMSLWINGLEIEDSFSAKLIERVKGKKEFRLILDSMIVEQIKLFSHLNYSKLKKTLLKAKTSEEFAKSELSKKCIKFSRSRLRKKTGLYIKTKDEKDILNLSEFDSRNIKRMLLAHKSSFERDYHYLEIYQKIFEQFKKYYGINSKGHLRILDIGCGLNPLSYIFIEKKIFLSSVYFALDIDKRALEIVGRFFRNRNLKYKLFNEDILNLADSSNSKKLNLLPDCDLAFAFKVLELIEKKGHKNSEKLISSIKAKMIVASFPKKTISGKRMNVLRKPWLERMLERIGYKYEIFEIPGEIFYLILKS